MLARAAVAVTAGSDLVVETTVDFVLLGTEDGGEIVSHDDCGKTVMLSGEGRVGSGGGGGGQVWSCGASQKLLAANATIRASDAAY